MKKIILALVISLGLVTAATAQGNTKNQAIKEMTVLLKDFIGKMKTLSKDLKAAKTAAIATKTLKVFKTDMEAFEKKGKALEEKYKDVKDLFNSSEPPKEMEALMTEIQQVMMEFTTETAALMEKWGQDKEFMEAMGSMGMGGTSRGPEEGNEGNEGTDGNDYDD